MAENYVGHISYSREVNKERIHKKCDIIGQETEILSEIFSRIEDGSLRRLEMQQKESDLSLSLFVEKDRFFVGTVDMYEDEVFYYTNESDDRALVDIDGGFYERRFVGTDLKLLCAIIEHFAKNRMRYDKVKWLEDEG